MDNKSESKGPETIVCAIRGGESSRRAQERAIELCVEQGCSITFVHVVDADAIRQSDTPLADIIVQEMDHLGLSLLNIAVERATSQHVQAQSRLLHGPVRAALENFLHDTPTSILVMGTPDSASPHNAFDSAQLEQYIQHLKTHFNIDVQVV